MNRRHLPLIVISDVHLGTYGCHATELLLYLKSVQPGTLILNGDIIDGWQFSKSYFPPAHFAVIREIFKLITLGTKVIYLTGNHDEFLRKYTGLEIGNIHLANKYLLNIDDKKMWFFHGDVFDNSTKGFAKILARLGGKGYDLLILMNRAVNYLLKLTGRERVSFSKKIKNSVKQAIAFINDFEQTIAALAIEKQYDYVVCGHIHQPTKKVIETETGFVNYLNSGDWIENLTALEYDNKEWKIFQYNDADFILERAMLPSFKNKKAVDTETEISFLYNLKNY